MLPPFHFSCDISLVYQWRLCTCLEVQYSHKTGHLDCSAFFFFWWRQFGPWVPFFTKCCTFWRLSQSGDTFSPAAQDQVSLSLTGKRLIKVLVKTTLPESQSMRTPLLLVWEMTWVGWYLVTCRVRDHSSSSTQERYNGGCLRPPCRLFGTAHSGRHPPSNQSSPTSWQCATYRPRQESPGCYVSKFLV